MSMTDIDPDILCLEINAAMYICKKKNRELRMLICFQHVESFAEKL